MSLFPHPGLPLPQPPKPRPTLFLDIDGVLNWASTPDRINGFIGLCPTRIARLNQITVPTNAEIVISSTWRLMYPFVELRDLLKARGVTGEIVGTTATGVGRERGRGKEILAYLSLHPEIKNYAVLDDDLAAADAGRVVRTGWYPLEEDSEGGLLERHVAEAVGLLRPPEGP